MLRSMTGFGRGARETDRGRLVVEIRAVNSRFNETRVRMPAESLELEMRLRDQIKAALARGKIDCTVRLEATPDAPAPIINAPALRATFDALRRAVEGLPLAEGGITLEALLRAAPREDFTSELWGDETFQREVEAAVADALAALTQARGAEGRAIAAVLASQIGQIEAAAVAVRAQAPLIAEQYVAKLKQRIEEMMAGPGIAADPARLEQELIYYAQRVDVTEELDRLEVHCRSFRGLLESPEPVGRKMDFLVQEILREINTLGAKVKDVGIVGQVVDLKVVVEQIREQVQNVE
jgi:uncharacterized protein (TIGR00255 family)